VCVAVPAHSQGFFIPSSHSLDQYKAHSPALFLLPFFYFLIKGTMKVISLFFFL